MDQLDYASFQQVDDFVSPEGDATTTQEPEAQPSVEPTAEQPSEEKPATEPESNQAEPATTTEEKEPTQPDYSSLYSDLGVDSVDTIKTRLQEYESLKSEIETLRNQPKPELEFPSEGAKKLYEYATKFAGMETEKAREFLHIQALDVSKLSPKEALWEDFLLDEDNSDLSREEARQLFDLKYGEAFDEDADPLKKRDAIVQANKAKRRLSEKQTDFSSIKKSSDANPPEADPKVSEQKQAELKRNVEKALQGYDTFKAQIDKDKSIDIRIESSDAGKIREAMENPVKFINDTILQFADDHGSFDWNGWRSFATKMVMADKIANHSYSEAYAAGKESVLKDIKNPPKPNPSNPTPTVDPQRQTWLNAAAAMGKKLPN